MPGNRHAWAPEVDNESQQDYQLRSAWHGSRLAFACIRSCTGELSNYTGRIKYIRAESRSDLQLLGAYQMIGLQYTLVHVYYEVLCLDWDGIGWHGME